MTPRCFLRRISLFAFVLLFALLSRAQQAVKPLPAAAGAAKANAQQNLQASASSSAFQSIQAQVSATQQKLASLQAQVGSLTTLGDKIDNLTAQVRALTQLHESEAQNQVISEKNRYIAGKELLVVMSVDLNHLQSGLVLTQAFNDIDQLANPLNDPKFSNQFAIIKKQLANVDNNGAIAKSPAVASLMANPYLSTAFTMGSLLLSRLHRDTKPQMLSDMACTLTFSSDLASDTRITQSDLDNLVTAATAMEGKIQRYGQTYLRLVHYKTNWADYMTARGQGFDPASEAVDAFFQHADPEQRNQAQAEVAYVRSIAGQYQALLVRADDLYTQTITKLQDRANYMCGGASYPRAAKLSPIIGRLETARTQFRAGYLSDVSFVSQLNQSN